MHCQVFCLLFAAVAICSARTKDCTPTCWFRKQGGLKVDAVQGAQCSKRSYGAGANVSLSCKRGWYSGPHGQYVICREDGWSLDLSKVICVKSSSRSEIRDAAAPELFLHISHSDIRRCSAETCPIAVKIERRVGSALSVTCEIKWNSCDPRKIPHKKFPELELGWYAPDGSQVLENVHVSPGSTADLDLNFAEAGIYVYSCKIRGWTPWPPLQAVIEVEVKKALCPEVRAPYNTHFVGQIKDENRTVRSIIQVWPNPGYTTWSGGPLETTCKENELWYPSVGDLTVEPVLCPRLNVQDGMRIRLVDGPQDYRYQSLVELSCSDQYTLMGDSRTFCNASAMWDPAPATCRRLSCGSPPTNIQGVSCHCPNNSIGTVCICDCMKGYRFDRRSEKELRCLSSGWWPPVNRLPTCIVCQCSRQPPNGWKWAFVPRAGWVRNGRKKVYCNGVEITAVCRKNSLVHGTMRCVGQDWEWNSKPPKCN